MTNTRIYDYLLLFKCSISNIGLSWMILLVLTSSNCRRPNQNIHFDYLFKTDIMLLLVFGIHFVMNDSDNVNTMLTFLCVHDFNIIQILYTQVAKLAFEDMITWMQEGGQVNSFLLGTFFLFCFPLSSLHKFLSSI